MFELGVGPVFSDGWKAFAENIGKVLLFALFYFIGIVVAMIPITLILGGAFFTMILAGASGGKEASQMFAGLAGGTLFLFVIVYIVVLIALIGWYAGFAHGLKMIMSGGSPEFSDLFSQYRKLGNLILLGIILGVLIGIASIFLIIPGIILAVLWSQSYLLVIDKDMDAISAMSASWKRVASDFWAVLGVIVVLALAFGIVGSLLSMIPVLGGLVDLFFLMPFAFMCIWALYFALFPPVPDAQAAPTPPTDYAEPTPPPPPPPPPPPTETQDNDQGITLK